MDRGWVTSATIMVKMPASEKAIAYARTRSDLSFGVHLVYGGDGIEAPVLPPSEVRALVAPDGTFRQSNTTRLMALFRRIPRRQIERETEAQLGALMDRGVRLTHVDSHGHLHKFHSFREALRRVLPKFGVRKVRNVQDTFVERRVGSVTYWLSPMWRRSLMKAFETTNHFFMPSGKDHEVWARPLAESLRRSGTLEVGVHPGTREGWRSDQRASIEEFVREAKVRSHGIIGWRDL
jgi:predicted glycoside hydrolase/deacetylase ChbG (UPF0249 family)